MTTYPINMPSIGVKALVIRKSSAVGTTESPYSYAQEVIAFPGQRWEADITFPSATLSEAGAIEAFFGLLNGSYGTFLMGDPARSVPYGAAASSPGTPLADGAQSAYAQTLKVKGGPTSITAWLKAGDYIQLGSGASSRLHQVLADADTDGSGKTTLSIWPYLRADLSDGDAITVSGCKGLFRVSGKSEISRQSSILDCSFSAVEAL